MIDTSVLNIDFDINHCSTNCKVLQIMDLSNWGPAINNLVLISITTPGSTVAIDNVFQKNKINIFNSNNLNLSDVEDYSTLSSLPDGVYQVCVKTCLDGSTNPVTYAQTCKYFLVDCTIRCQVSRLLMSVDLNCNPCKEELLKPLQEVLLFLDAAQAQVNNCNSNKAMEYYNRDSILLKRISINPQKPCTGCGGDITIGY